MNSQEYMLARVNSILLSKERKQSIMKHMTEENTSNLKKLYNIHKGERCFILGCAPSLKQLDLTKLNTEYTFTVNKGYKLRDLGLEHSNYHLIMDRELLNDNGVLAELPTNFSDLFFLNAELDYEKENWNKLYVEILNSNMIKFQEDITKPLMTTATVISQAIQIAYYMGFSDIYLLGVDLDFSKNSGHVYTSSFEEKEREKTLSIKGEKVMLDGLNNITKFLTSKGINIYNASPAGVLDCMPRVKYETLF